MLKETLNHDIAGIVRRQIRFVKEALKMQSANVFHVIDFDIRRLKAYLTDVDVFKAHVASDKKNQVDLPEHHPYKMAIELPEISEVDAVENESISDWARLMLISSYELVDSQSSRLCSGLISHDSNRYDLISAKIRSLVEDYIEKCLPEDVPETVPSVASVTAGNKGV